MAFWIIRAKELSSLCESGVGYGSTALFLARSFIFQTAENRTSHGASLG